MFLIALVLILLDIFRMPLLALLHIQHYGFLFHLGFLVIPFLFYSKINIKNLSFGFFEIWLIVSLFSSALLLTAGMEKGIFVSQVLPILFPPALIVLFKILDVDESKLYKLLDSVLYYSFYIGSSYFIGEWLLVQKLKLFSQCDFSTWFNGHIVDQYCAPGRRMLIGFLIFKDFGLAFIMGSYFSLRKGSLKKQSINFVLIFLCLVLTDSITLIAIFFLLLIIQNASQIKKHFQIAFFIFLSLVSVFFQTSTFSRIMSYITLELNLTNYLPVYSGCDFKLYSLDSFNISCNSNEVHSLYYLIKFGILPTVCWYLAFIMSVFYIVKAELNKRNARLLYFNLVFVLSAIHYSGAESWGINFIFVMILYLANSKQKPVIS